MYRIILCLLFAVVLTSAGCGGGAPTLNTRSLSEEEKRKIKEEDQRVDDEERAGSARGKSATKRK